jgi:hypothetical protein
MSFLFACELVISAVSFAVPVVGVGCGTKR